MISPDGKNLVFILSLPRSGSTLLSAMLGSHSRILSPPEPWFLLPLEGVRHPSGAAPFSSGLAKAAVDAFLPDGLFTESCRSFCLTAYNSKLSEAGVDIFVDKTPRYFHILDWIEGLFPCAKKVWLMRNPLDVAASYQKEWHVPVDSLVGKKVDENTYDFLVGFPRLVEYFSKSCEHKYTLAYEDLVSEPAKTLTALCYFLGVDFEPGQLEFLNGTWAAGAKHSMVGDRKIFSSKGVHADSINRWQEELPREDCVRLAAALGGEVLKKAGYPGIAELINKSSQKTSWIAPSQKTIEIQFGERFKETVQDKERLIHEKEKQISSLKQWCNEKDEEIKALRAWQSSIERRIHNRILSRLKSILRPRLGVLRQYSPRELCPPPLPAQQFANEELPSVSIITPTFNQGDYIAKTICSVLDQGYPKLEYFVQDGGSTDDTKGVLEKYGKELAGWNSQRDEGQAQAINFGFSRTSGEIMAWLNSDDLFLPGTLAHVAEFFVCNPDVDVVYGNRILIDENGMEIGRWIMPGHDQEVLSWIDYVPQETLFWRRSLWEKVGGRVDESFQFAMDWDLLLRFREAGGRFAHLPRFLGAFRVHGGQKTSAVLRTLGIQEMNRLRQRVLGRVPNDREIRKAVMPFLLRHIAVDLADRVKNRLAGRIK
jgi:GT2 family glycosyltransferase